MTFNDKITIPMGAKIKHVYVCAVPRSSNWFRVEWRNKHGKFSMRTLLYADEGSRWAHGHISGLDADALVAAQALVGESPWSETKMDPVIWMGAL